MNEPNAHSVPTITPPESTDAAVPPPTLAEVLRKRIADAAAPLKYSDLKRDLKRAKKQTKEAFESEIRHLVDEEIRAGLAFEYPAKKPTDPPLYGSTPYRSPNDRSAVTEAMLGHAVAPRKLADLIKAALKATKAEKEFVGIVANELITSEKLHAHPAKKPTDPPLYGSTPYRPPNDRPAVAEALLAAAAVPRKLAVLIKEVTGATKADKEFVHTVVNELIAAAQLHDRGNGKLYGREKPLQPDPFGSKKSKTALAKLTEAARKLMAATGVALEEILQRLQVSLREEPTTPLTPAQVPAAHPTLHTPQPYGQPEFTFETEAQNGNMPTVGG